MIQPRFKLRCRTKRTLIVFATLVAMTLVAIAAWPQSNRSETRRRIWGVVALAEGSVIIFETQGGMVRLDLKTGKESTLVEHFQPRFVVDATLGMDENGEETVLLNAGWVRTWGVRYQWVASYSPGGSLIREWTVRVPRVPAGIAFDPGERVLFMADAQTGEVYSISLDSSENDPRRRFRIRDADAIGPLAFDPVTRTLFAADGIQGELHAVSVASGESRLAAEGLGEPSALALDATRRLLYVADTADGTIWRIDLEQVPLAPEPFLESFDSPTGLSVDPEGRLWIADPPAGHVVAIGLAGEKEYRFP